MSEQIVVSPKQLAEQVAEVMSKVDKVSAQLGIKRLEVGPGYAHMTLTVDASMTNGHEICHSGILFSLADITCAYAACSRNENNLAQNLHVQLLSPVSAGTQLHSHAKEVSVVGRTGIYDVEITDEQNAPIALVRCQCRTIKGSVSKDIPRGCITA